MKWIIPIALLASVATPALAQDGPPHGDHQGGPGRGGDHGGDHGGGRPAPQGQPQDGRPQFQPGRPPSEGPRPQFQQGQGQPHPGPDQGRPRFQPHGGNDGRNFGGPGGPQPGVQIHRGDGRQPGFQGQPGGWQNGRPDRGPGDHGPGDRGPDGRPGWNGGRPGFAGRPGPDPRGGGGWNRGWRDDHRYDWRGWRDTHRSFYHVGGYRAPYGYGWGYRRFDVGVRIDPVFFAQNYWISDPWYYRLPPADGPYRWVRYYNDALLIDTYSGTVVDAIPDFFW